MRWRGRQGAFLHVLSIDGIADGHSGDLFNRLNKTVFSLNAGAVGRGSARAGASRLASPRRMNQTETLRFRLAAAIVTADKQIGPGPSFSKRSRGSRLVSGHTKACYESRSRRFICGFKRFGRSGREAPARATEPGPVFKAPPRARSLDEPGSRSHPFPPFQKQRAASPDRRPSHWRVGVSGTIRRGDKPEGQVTKKQMENFGEAGQQVRWNLPVI